MRNLHLIEARFLGPTNFKGARVKLISYVFNESITLNYDYEIGNIRDQASNWLRDHGFVLEGYCEISGKSYGFLSSTFKGLKS